MILVCLDLEGVLLPEFWINVAERTGISELSRTTRDEPDYDKLMRFRLEILDREGLTLPRIVEVIEGLEPLEGACAFLDWLREQFQVLILSDTFYGFAAPMMRKLGYPTLFCHDLEVEENGRIANYRLRMPDQKRASVRALRALEFPVIACSRRRMPESSSARRTTSSPSSRRFRSPAPTPSCRRRSWRRDPD
jgi:phosphoserine/homoserine phosphotransferase